MSKIYISSAEVARDFSEYLTKAQNGAQIVIHDVTPPVMLCIAEQAVRTSLSAAGAAENKSQTEPIPALLNSFPASVEAIITVAESIAQRYGVCATVIDDQTARTKEILCSPPRPESATQSGQSSGRQASPGNDVLFP